MAGSPQKGSSRDGGQKSEALTHPLSVYVIIAAAFRLGLLKGALPPVCDTTAAANGKSHIAHAVYAPDRGVRLIERTNSTSDEWFVPEAFILAGRFEGFKIERVQPPEPVTVPPIMQELTLADLDDEDGPIIPAEAV